MRKTEQVGSLLPRSKSKVLEYEDALDFFAKPDLWQFRKAFEQVLANHGIRAAPAVVGHEVVPEGDLHLPVDHKYSDIYPFNDEVGQMNILQGFAQDGTAGSERRDQFAEYVSHLFDGLFRHQHAEMGNEVPALQGEIYFHQQRMSP